MQQMHKIGHLTFLNSQYTFNVLQISIENVILQHTDVSKTQNVHQFMVST